MFLWVINELSSFGARESKKERGRGKERKKEKEGYINNLVF